jgi:hypothetical protein
LSFTPDKLDITAGETPFVVPTAWNNYTAPVDTFKQGS